MHRDVGSGVAIIAGALAGSVALAVHPTGRDLLGGADPGGKATLNVIVHAIALLGTPLVFLGLLGVVRRLGWPQCGVAGLVFWAFGGVAVLGAATASGFIATVVAGRIREADDATRPALSALFTYTGLMNHAFAGVSVIASCIAIVLISVAIWRRGGLPRGIAVMGFIVGGVVALLVLSGQLGLDVHGFGLITFAQAAWLLWIGVVMVRVPGPDGPMRHA